MVMNVNIIIGASMSSSVNNDNKKKDILIRSKDPTNGLDYTISTAKKEYSINFTEQEKNFCVIFQYNGANSYIFVNGIEI